MIRDTATAVQERGRRKIVSWILIVYLLLIIEGALRRWIFHHYEYVVFFIRVPFVLWIYVLTVRYRLWPRGNPLLIIGMGFAIAAVLLIPLQLFAGGYDTRHLLIAGYGWHNYFFYIPLAFIIAHLFDYRDLDRVMLYTLLLSLPDALIVIWQFLSPASAAINQGFSTDAGHQFQLLGASLDHIRPSGFFTSTAGHSDYVGSFTAMIASLWLLHRRQRHLPTGLLTTATGALIIMLAFSGSRETILKTAIVLLGVLTVGLISHRRRIVFISILIIPSFLAITLALYPLLFPKGFEVLTVRWTGAYEVESQQYGFGIFGRALSHLYLFLSYIPHSATFGYLIGLGGNATSRLSWTTPPSEILENINPEVVQPEDTFWQNLFELGLFGGLAFIFYRLVLVIDAGFRAVHTTRFTGHPLAFLLFCFVAPQFIFSQMTGHGTHIGYAWMFLGFCLAASQHPPATINYA